MFFFKAFVFSGEVTPSQVLEILKSRPDESEMNENSKRVWKYMTKFVEDADSRG